jgi:hypothetical protein
MTNEIETEIEAVVADVKTELTEIKTELTPEIKTAENDAKAIGSAALSYIQTNGLTDLYAIATSVLTSIASGTAWSTVLSTVVTQGEAAGITIAKGAESVVVAQAQADLIAAGTLAAPSTAV